MREDYVHLSLERRDHVLEVTMSNPPKHTMVPAEVVELNTMMNDVEADDSIRVLVLTGGSEEFFVRSYDVGQLADSSEAQRSGKAREPAPAPDPRARSFQGFMRRMESWSGITIAALNGNAAGGGFELALSCDFRVMREGPFLVGLPETSVGIIPGAGGTQRMPRLINPAVALDLIVHGKRITSDEALALGLVNRVFPAESWYEDVAAFAEGVASRAPIAVRAAKRAIREGLTMSLDDGLKLESQLFRELMQTEDAAQALRNAAEGKALGDFKGR